MRRAHGIAPAIRVPLNSVASLSGSTLVGAAICRRMGEAADQTARKFSWDRNAQQTRELFERTWQAKSAR